MLIIKGQGEQRGLKMEGGYRSVTYVNTSTSDNYVLHLFNSRIYLVHCIDVMSSHTGESLVESIFIGTYNTFSYHNVTFFSDNYVMYPAAVSGFHFRRSLRNLN